MSGGPEILGLIPARGGSKSIPRKNIRLINGKPLLAYSIGHALASRRITRVVVSTDDAEIAEAARAAGAEVPFLRPAELAGDDSLDIAYHRHALDWLGDHESYRPAAVVNLRPTHPIRRPATIDRAIETLLAHPEADCVRSVRLSELSPFKMWLLDEAGGPMVPATRLEGCAEPYNMPRQRLPVAYWQDGYVDVAWSRTILEKNSTTGDVILPFLIDEECVDIDYEEEIAAAESLLGGDGKPAPRPSATPSSRRHSS